MSHSAPIPTRDDGPLVHACLVQGGLVMAHQGISTAPLVVPTQVWASLSPELQGRAVRLLAHCHGLIDGAEQTVALLAGVDDQGQPLTTPFDAKATTNERDANPSSDRKVSPDSTNSSRFPDSDSSALPF